MGHRYIGNMTLTIPLASRELCGRDEELAELEERVCGGAGLVSVTGPAGIGKTSLLTAFAGRVLGGELPVLCDELVWIDWGRGQSVGAALGLLSDASPERVTAHLASRGCAYVILDDAEGMDPAVIAGWLRAAPKLTVLLGTRVPLGLPEEHLVELAGIDVEAGVALITKLAGLRGAPLGAPAAVEELVRVVDGHPLALTLCAARLGLMSPSSLLKRVKARGATSIPGLGAALREGLEALSEEDKEALQALTAFRGFFTFDAAEGVLGDRALEAVEALRGTSLLSAEGDGDVVRLHVLAPIREVAGPPTAAQLARHSAFYGAWSKDRVPGGRDALELRREVEANATELLAVARRAVESAPEREAGAWCLALLAKIPETTGRSVVCAVGRRLLAQGTDGVSPVALGWAAAELGWLLIVTGDKVGAAEELERASGWAAAADSASLTVRTLAVEGRLLRQDREFDAAMAKLHEARDLAREVGDVQRYRIEKSLALAHLVARDLETSYRLMLDAIEGERLFGSKLDADMYLANLATVHSRLGQPKESRECLRSCLIAARQFDDQRAVGFITGSLAEANLCAGAHEEAARQFVEAQESLHACGDIPLSANLLVPQATLMMLMGQPADARRCLARSRALLERAPIPTVTVRMLLADSALVWPPTEDSLDSLRQALELAEKAKDARRAAVARLRLAAGRALLGEPFEPPPRPENPLLLAVASYYDAQGRGDREEARRLVAGLETMPAPGSGADAAPASHCDIQVRVAAHHTRRWLERYVAPEVEAVAGIELDFATRRARPPGGAWCDLERRSLLWRLIEVLSEQRLAQPGVPLPLGELLSALWPGEVMVQKSGRARLYTAVAQLRKMGFREVLVSNREGYYFDPDIPLVRERVAPDHP